MIFNSGTFLFNFVSVFGFYLIEQNPLRRSALDQDEMKKLK